MSITLCIKRGTEQQIMENELAVGEMALATDTSAVFIYNGVQKSVIGHVAVDTLDNRPQAVQSGRMFLDSTTDILYVDTDSGWKSVGNVDNLDGDKLPIDWNPSNWDPEIVEGVTSSTGQLTSHLKGIDEALAQKSHLEHEHVTSYASIAHSNSHGSGGSDEIDGDSLDLDWNPSNYVPTKVNETGTEEHLASHLNGLDLALANIARDKNSIENTLAMMAWDIYSGDRAFDDIYVDDFTDTSGVDGTVLNGLVTGNSSGVYDAANSFFASVAAQNGVTQDLTSSQLDCSSWSRILSVTVTENTPGNSPASAIYHAVSFDSRLTWKIFRNGLWTSIARNNGGVWQYSDAGIWTDASLNSLDEALIQATEQGDYRWTKDMIEAMSADDWCSAGGWSEGVNTIDWTTRLVDGWTIVADGSLNESTTDAVPPQTDGTHVLESSYTASYEGWKIFNDEYGSPQKRWLTAINNTTGWVQFDFGAGNRQVINKYRWFTMESDSNAVPSAWQFQGSNDGSSWTTLHEGINEVQAADTWIGWFTFINDTFYRYYRINVTANCGHEQYLTMDDLEMVAAQSVAIPTFTKVSFTYDVTGTDLSLVTRNWESSVEDPTDAYCVIDIEPIDAVIFNSDFKAFISINDGMNWDQIGLDPGPFRRVGSHNYVRGDLYGITPRSDGTIRFKFSTHNNKTVKLHSIAGGVRYHD